MVLNSKVTYNIEETARGYFPALPERPGQSFRFHDLKKLESLHK
jgi:hypothetical protein